jgi:hypothetical protein
MSELLYQMIMKVPGLSGTWQQRNRQLYEKLGSPLGKYAGSYDQNSYLRNQVKSNNYFTSGLPGQTGGTQAQGTGQNPQERIAGSHLENVNPDKRSFSEDVMPQDQWNAIFDEWTHNFVQTEMKPEWERENYNPAMRDMTKGIGEANQQLGLSGAWRSGMGRKNLANMAKDMVKQEEGMRRDFQSGTLDTRDAVRSGIASPLYDANMKRWGDSPFNTISTEGVDTTGGVGGIGGDDLEGLINQIGNWTPNDETPAPTLDWTVKPDSIYGTNLFNQYIGRSY